MIILHHDLNGCWTRRIVGIHKYINRTEHNMILFRLVHDIHRFSNMKYKMNVKYHVIIDHVLVLMHINIKKKNQQTDGMFSFDVGFRRTLTYN